MVNAERNLDNVIKRKVLLCVRARSGNLVLAERSNRDRNHESGRVGALIITLIASLSTPYLDLRIWL